MIVAKVKEEVALWSLAGAKAMSYAARVGFTFGLELFGKHWFGKLLKLLIIK
jgi:hypothetical protein